MRLRTRSEVLSSASAWKIEECADCTLIVGRDFAWQWLLYTTMAMALFGFAILEWRWGLSVGIVAAAASLAAVATLALGRGFRLRISRSGFVFVRTWLGLPYWRKTLPIAALCTLNDPPDSPPDGLFLESKLYHQDVFFGGVDNCRDLHAAIVAAQEHWKSRPAT